MKILVTGATGNVGRLVVDHLLGSGAEIRALTNNPTKANLPATVEVAEGYLGKLDTLPAALAGVDRMDLAPLPHTAREVVALAREAGVKHIVALTGAKYVLTGPESLSKIDRVRIIGEAIGRDLRWVELPHDEARAEMLARGYGDAADWLLDGDALAVDHPQFPDPTVSRLLGRPARTFAEWAAANADAFR